jgi:membrane fusion protein (multidrug efflux system)
MQAACSRGVRDAIRETARATMPRAWFWIGLALALASASCSRSEDDTQVAAQKGQAAPLPVTVITVQPKTLPVNWEVIGQTQGSREVEVRPRVTGILLERLYTEGSFVKRGTVLFRIDPLPFQTALEQIRGIVGQAEAELARTEQDVARLRPLFADNAVSKKELDDAVAALHSARANLFSARAQYKAAEIDLGYTSVEAFISGVTSRAAVSEGSLVTAQQTLLTRIFQVDPLWVTFSFSSKDYAEMQNDMQAGRVTLPPASKFTVELQRLSGDRYERTGVLNFRDTTVDPKTGTIQARAQFPNPDAEVLAGEFVRLRIRGATHPNAILIPQRAMVQGPTGQNVYVLTESGKADLRAVTVGETRGENIIVVDGLVAGDRVILDGLVKLRPGAPVKAVAAPAAEESAPAAKTLPAGAAGKR